MRFGTDAPVLLLDCPSMIDMRRRGITISCVIVLPRGILDPDLGSLLRVRERSTAGGHCVWLELATLGLAGRPFDGSAVVSRSAEPFASVGCEIVHGSGPLCDTARGLPALLSEMV